MSFVSRFDSLTSKAVAVRGDRRGRDGQIVRICKRPSCALVAEALALYLHLLVSQCPGGLRMRATSEWRKCDDTFLRDTEGLSVTGFSIWMR